MLTDEPRNNSSYSQVLAEHRYTSFRVGNQPSDAIKPDVNLQTVSDILMDGQVEMLPLSHH